MFPSRPFWRVSADVAAARKAGCLVDSGTGSGQRFVGAGWPPVQTISCPRGACCLESRVLMSSPSPQTMKSLVAIIEFIAQSGFELADFDRAAASLKGAAQASEPPVASGFALASGHALTQQALSGVPEADLAALKLAKGFGNELLHLWHIRNTHGLHNPKLAALDRGVNICGLRGRHPE
jgi:hypothetical protein